MLRYIKNKLKNLFERRFVILLVATILLSIIGGRLTTYSSLYIQKHFETPPVVRDLMWDKLPYIPLQEIGEIIMLLSAVYLIIWALKTNKYYIPYTLFLYAVFVIIRSGLIVLTPLGFPFAYDGILQKSKDSILMNGAFPSGHLSVPFLIFLVTKKPINLILAILVGLTLLTSRRHYSIDLAGTIFIAYSIYTFSEKYIKQYFFKK